MSADRAVGDGGVGGGVDVGGDDCDGDDSSGDGGGGDHDPLPSGLARVNRLASPSTKHFLTPPLPLPRILPRLVVLRQALGARMTHAPCPPFRAARPSWGSQTLGKVSIIGR